MDELLFLLNQEYFLTFKTFDFKSSVLLVRWKILYINKT